MYHPVKASSKKSPPRLASNNEDPRRAGFTGGEVEGDVVRSSRGGTTSGRGNGDAMLGAGCSSTGAIAGAATR